MITNASGGEDFQADDRGDQRRDEEQSPEAGGFLEDQDADEDGPDGTDARPYRIGRPDRDRLARLGEAERKTAFTQPGNNQDNPIHNL